MGAYWCITGMQHIGGINHARDKPEKEYPLTTLNAHRRGDTGGAHGRTMRGKMVSETSRDSAAKTLHNISRDMGRCILHLLFFGASIRCISGGRAITQFPRDIAHAAKKWAITLTNS